MDFAAFIIIIFRLVVVFESALNSVEGRDLGSKNPNAVACGSHVDCYDSVAPLKVYKAYITGNAYFGANGCQCVKNQCQIDVMMHGDDSTAMCASCGHECRAMGVYRYLMLQDKSIGQTSNREGEHAKRHLKDSENIADVVPTSSSSQSTSTIAESGINWSNPLTEDESSREKLSSNEDKQPVDAPANSAEGGLNDWNDSWETSKEDKIGSAGTPKVPVTTKMTEKTSLTTSPATTSQTASTTTATTKQTKPTTSTAETVILTTNVNLAVKTDLVDEEIQVGDSDWGSWDTSSEDLEEMTTVSSTTPASVSKTTTVTSTTVDDIKTTVPTTTTETTATTTTTVLPTTTKPADLKKEDVVLSGKVWWSQDTGPHTTDKAPANEQEDLINNDVVSLIGVDMEVNPEDDATGLFHPRKLAIGGNNVKRTHEEQQHPLEQHLQQQRYKSVVNNLVDILAFERQKRPDNAKMFWEKFLYPHRNKVKRTDPDLQSVREQAERISKMILKLFS